MKYLMLGYCFETLGFERVEFKTDVLNLPARKALARIGATEEGILRSHTLMINNRRRDTIYFSILKPEWERLKAIG
jgi:RimJ/RimL family protein N-acetyltransferase